jgi:hypothetical protein
MRLVTTSSKIAVKTGFETRLVKYCQKFIMFTIIVMVIAVFTIILSLWLSWFFEIIFVGIMDIFVIYKKYIYICILDFFEQQSKLAIKLLFTMS